MFPNDIVIIHETTSQIAITKLIPAVIAAKTPPTVFLVLLIILPPNFYPNLILVLPSANVSTVPAGYSTNISFGRRFVPTKVPFKE